MYRQGDVLIIPIRTTPPPLGEKLPLDESGEGVILAHGEATGHKHFLRGRDVGLWELAGGDPATRFCRVGGGAVLRHEEHGKINIPAGNYLIRRQREYTPEALRLVGD